MTTAPSRDELARKRPANIPAPRRSARGVVDGRVVTRRRRMTGTDLASRLLLVLVALLFAGMLLGQMSA